jgi:hypothetical protein
METLQKHVKYNSMYKPNILYWGLGIENELYLEFENKITFKKSDFINNHKKERYSVDYYSSYKQDILKTAFKYSKYNKDFPLLLNSFSFTKTDKHNNSKTRYTKLCEDNPSFSGTVLTEYILQNNKYLNNEYDKSFVYDGDTIEFITTNFFNTQLINVIDELTEIKHKYITNIRNIFQEHSIYKQYGNVNFMKQNYPFGMYLTNLNNIAIFNNGTLHFNITLPSMLDNNGKIQDMIKFTNEHMNYIRLIQFMEPLIVSIYGTPDPFSYIIQSKNNINQDIINNSLLFSSCSQRCAVSRYISLGTYDTNSMKIGKLLVDDTSNFTISNESYGWYNIYYKTCAYNKNGKIGYDINFNKHYNHGIEIRFIDHISDINLINEVFDLFIYLGDYVLEFIKINQIENPIFNTVWNKLVVDCMKFGSLLELTDEYILMYNKVFDHKFTSTNIKDLYYEIFNLLKNKSKTNNMFSKHCYNVDAKYVLV